MRGEERNEKEDRMTSSCVSVLVSVGGTWLKRSGAAACGMALFSPVLSAYSAEVRGGECLLARVAAGYKKRKEKPHAQANKHAHMPIKRDNNSCYSKYMHGIKTRAKQGRS